MGSELPILPPDVAGPGGTGREAEDFAGVIHAGADLPRIPVARDRQQRLQRQPRPGARAARPRRPPALPGPAGGDAALGRRRRELDRRRARGRAHRGAGAGGRGLDHRLHARHRRPPAHLRGRRLRGLPLAHLPGAERRGGRGLHRRQRRRGRRTSRRGPAASTRLSPTISSWARSSSPAPACPSPRRSTAAPSPTPSSRIPRFLPYAREGMEAARAVLVGSRHTAESLWETVALAGLPERTRLGPPGVDVRAFSPLGGASPATELGGPRRARSGPPPPARGRGSAAIRSSPSRACAGTPPPRGRG